MKIAHLTLVLVAAAGGWLAATVFQAGGRIVAPSLTEARIAERPNQCPMHPWVKSAKPGQCTVCGMALVALSVGGIDSGGPVNGLVLLPVTSVKAIGLQTAEVKRQPLVRTLRVAGIIGEDESRHGVITAPVEGRIDGLGMSCEGDRVTRRQPLATIFSRPLLAAAADYNASLAKGGPGLARARSRLLQYGLVWEQIASIPTRQPDDIYFGLPAPLTGTIVKSYISEGQFVKEGDKLFEIADFMKMWFVFSAYERDLAMIRVGQLVSVTTPSLPGETLRARVSFISPNLDELTRSARVRVVLENPDRRIKNNTQAQALVECDAPEVLSVPRSAVIRPDSTARVYVQSGPGRFQQRQIKLGRVGDDSFEVIEGLNEGEHVVVTGSMLIDSQAQLNLMATVSDTLADKSDDGELCGLATLAKRGQPATRAR